ncbi:MAG: glycosyltransferase [Bacteroidales bacterium]|nr:glycosyltransferase [Bacteroidales bacterium]
MEEELKTIDSLYSEYCLADQKIESMKKKGWFHGQILTYFDRQKRENAKDRIIAFVNNNHKVEALTPNSQAPIVSLTTFTPRISSVHITIESIFRQTIKPSRVVLWLSLDEFSSEDVLPVELKNLKEKGLEIFFVEGNLRSHKKYLYAFEKYGEEHDIITIDDDLIYPSDTIERLLNTHEKYPYSVCANVVRHIKINGKAFAEYRSWPKVSCSDMRNSMLNVAIGMGGVLYPKGVINKKTSDMHAIRDISPFADDLYLKCVEVKSGVAVAVGEKIFNHPVIIPNTQKYGLQRTNMSHHNMNDEQWSALCDYFSISTSLLLSNTK